MALRSTLAGDERNEITFLDLETTVPTKRGQPISILDVGAILVCAKTLVERYSYSTLVRPTDLSLISTLSKRRSGITRAGVLSHPHSLKSHQISTTCSTVRASLSCLSLSIYILSQFKKI